MCCTCQYRWNGYFPDAPTQRGVKHLEELAAAVDAGYHCILAFVIQMDEVKEVRANVAVQPAFGEALEKAKAKGIEVLFLQCGIEEDGFEIIS